MTFKDTKYLFSKYQLSSITTVLTDDLELSEVIYSIPKRITAIDDELESLLKSGYAYYDDYHVLSPNFALLDVIVDVTDRVKTMDSLQHILDLKREKRELGNALNILTKIFKKGKIE